jgi:hypothetical protein
MKRLVLLVCGILAPTAPLHASQFYGLLQAETLGFMTGQSTARVSVSVPGPTSCENSRRYSYENVGLGASWTDMLIEAKAQRTLVLIVGTGVCDTFGMEGVRFISLPPPAASTR